MARKELTLKDRLSRLTFYQACKLLGSKGDKLIMQGGKVETLRWLKNAPDAIQQEWELIIIEIKPVKNGVIGTYLPIVWTCSFDLWNTKIIKLNAKDT